MKLEIVVRRTEPWGELRPDEFRDRFRRKMRHLDPEASALFLRNVDLWDRLFKPGYLGYRAALAAISRRNWGRVGAPVCPFPGTPDAILLPTDDDDWFHPDVGGEIAVALEDPSIRLVVWDCWKYQLYESHKFLPTQWEPDGMIVRSNGYAMRGNLDAEIIRNHSEARRFMQREPRHTAYIPRPLSVWLRHPGSFGWLRKTPLHLPPYGPLETPPDLEWAREEIDQAYRLTSGLGRLPIFP